MSIDKHAIGLLLSQVALRDRKAFEALYQLTSSRLYNVILPIVGDEHLAADILQEGFVKLWVSNYLHPVDYPWAWLCQCMRNLAIDEIRKRGRRSEESLENLIERGSHTAESLSDQHLSRCLLTLTEEKRSAIVLAYQYGMSHQEIVKHANTPLGTVKSWIRRGLQELKQCLSH
ncbi:RNA polymerase sigma factor [Vibrio sp. HDW18]|uniref:RNA polymerase sigma factor n=1 Tax=Vibrio sp. HDW18 TaxID=2714948 RepID=UPI00140CF7CD|nr:RNA polymerase sigma factor [Vibrio sp. HDW18]QIL85412.1 RNA polymerase sigma factor [Vibrio sp. HDW18]QIL85683.1 RNA polymerase sigma factor [Vibrio sp. HDW18]